MRQVLAVSELALSVMLLTGAATSSAVTGP
jgi:hypothetical protein